MWQSVLVCFLVFCLSSASGMLCSCSSENRQEGYIYYRLTANPTTLDPALIVDVTGGTLSAKLFNGLVRIGDNLSIEPDIAEKWLVSQEGRVFTFHLRKRVKFSNKREVNAYDFKYSFQRLLKPENKSPNRWVLDKIRGVDEFMSGKAEDVEGIRVLDDYTLQICLKNQFSPFISLLAMSAAYVVPREEVERWGLDFSSHPTGTGPFVLKEWLPNREIILEKRPDYFAAPAKVKGIVYRIIPEDLTAVAEFELGNLDVLNIPASEYSRYRHDEEKRKYISSVPGLNTYYIGLNCSRPPFDNPHMRKAVSYAVDREKILGMLYEKRGRLAGGPLPDVLRKWDISCPFHYNPGKARELVSEEGFSGKTIWFYLTADQEVVDIAEVIQFYLRNAGMDVRIRQLEWSAYKEAVSKGEPEMFYLSWWADYPDPENFLFPLFHSSNHGPAGNRTRYTNLNVDAMIEQGQHTMDERQRNIFYKKAEEMIIADVPWVPLWHKTDFTIRQPRVKNYRAYPIYSMDKGTDISF